jgi:2-polyprenyl-3-methyl-5-hydroxy-6-metoxy-1,4-benzoquinol methylase
MTSDAPHPPAPGVLRLVHRLVRGRWRATGETLYREVAALTEAGVGRELLVVGCGDGVTAQWLAARTGASVTAVDADAVAIGRLEEQRRTGQPDLALSFDCAPLGDLPHATAVFDAVVVEPPLSALADPRPALAEVVRVTRPMGTVVLLQPTWEGTPPADTRQLLVDRLGLRPRQVMEWKRLLREAGLVNLEVQDWSDAPARRSRGTVQGPTVTLGWRQKAEIAGRAWSRGGWRGMRAAVAREEALLQDISRDRMLTFQLITGVKWPHGAARTDTP